MTIEEAKALMSPEALEHLNEVVCPWDINIEKKDCDIVMSALCKSVTENVVEEIVQEGNKNFDKERYMANLPDVTFLMKNGTEYPYKGRITSLTGVVDAATGSLAAKATFPNPDGNLYSGIQGTIVINFTEKNVMVVPQNAVVRLQDQYLVYKVKKDSTAQSVTVTTAPTGNGKDVIILSGLSVGDKIITEGANNVQEGERVLFPEEKKK